VKQQARPNRVEKRVGEKQPDAAPQRLANPPDIPELFPQILGVFARSGRERIAEMPR
jgi:hypothetical protein